MGAKRIGDHHCNSITKRVGSLLDSSDREPYRIGAIQNQEPKGIDDHHCNSNNRKPKRIKSPKESMIITATATIGSHKESEAQKNQKPKRIDDHHYNSNNRKPKRIKSPKESRAQKNR